MEILRFLTAGSVDDGKSTLIGRLLYDSEAVSGDILEAIERSTKNKEEGIDLSLLTDGLRAEREQGITIDVAYKYFATPERKFIIADAPGHVQYTRNMVTAASTAELVIILVDARNGVAEQTRRHSIIAATLGIPNVVVAINKMDLIDFREDIFSAISADYKILAHKLGIKSLQIIPVSAKDGDNVVFPSKNMPWYTGPDLLNYLQKVQVKSVQGEQQRLQVQYVIRPMSDELHDYRGYAGSIQSGSFAIGDEVVVLPSGLKSTVKSIALGTASLQSAEVGQAITLELSDDIDISRGDFIVGAGQLPKQEQEIEATLCWMDSRPLTAGSKFLLQRGAKRVKAVVKEIIHEIDIHNLDRKASESIGLNGLAQVRIKTATPLVFDSYTNNRELGSAILIDETANTTVGALLLN